MKNIIRLMTVLSLAIVPAAYAAELTVLKYEPDSVDVPPKTMPGACAISLGRIIDTRNNKETLGNDYKPVLSPDPAPWVSAALANLKAYGFRIQNAGASADPGIAMDVALARSYTWHSSVRIIGMVAMTADFVLPSGQKVTRNYRASGSKLNTDMAADTYVTTLNYAMNNLLGKLAGDLQNMCAGKLP